MKIFELNWNEEVNDGHSLPEPWHSRQRGSITGKVEGIHDAVEMFERFLRSMGYDFHNVVVNLDDPKAIPKPISSPLYETKNWNDSTVWSLKSEGIKALTTADIQALTVKSYPTMGALTPEQVQSWQAPMPGTIGGAKVKLGQESTTSYAWDPIRK
jgi:hypothetical protein